MFTFSFGTAMAYTAPEATAVFANAYQQTNPEAKKVDYDGNTYGNTTDGDITTFTIDAAYIKKGIDKTYDNALSTISSTGTPPATSATVTVGATTYTFKNNQEADIALLKKLFNDEYNKEAAYEAAWDAYKAFLLTLVDKVDISKYSTKTGNTIVSKDGETYPTAADGAAADIAWAKKEINNASYTAGNLTTYTALYNAVFSAAGVITVAGDDEDPFNSTKYVTVSYSLVRGYKTKAAEAGDASTLEAKKASAKVALAAEVAALKANPAYKAAFDEAVNALVTAYTYLIENDDAGIGTYYPTLPTTLFQPLPFTKNATGNFVADGGGKDFVELVVQAEAAKKLAASMKEDVNEDGTKKYDNDNVDERLVAETINLYKTGAFTATLNEALLGTPTAYQTASQKLALQFDISDSDNGDGTFVLPVNTYAQTQAAALTPAANLPTASKTYYAKEWEAVKAGIEAYNQAINAATQKSDVDKAFRALAKVLTATDDKGAVDTAIAGKFTAPQGKVNLYLTAKLSTVPAGESIYVDWGIGSLNAYNTTSLSATGAELVTWYINKGARSTDDAEKLYAEACGVINAYKTKDTLKADAQKVVEMVKALPATITAADRDAVEKAFKAYTDLHSDVRGYVTNVGTLDDAIKALEKAEAYAIHKMLNDLPTPSKVTAADRNAVLAAQKTVKAYLGSFGAAKMFGTATPTYTGLTTTNPYNFATALTNLGRAQKEEIEDAVKALQKKKALGTLGVEDLKAVNALEELINTYNSDYPASASSTLTSITGSERALAEFKKQITELATAAAIKAVESVNLKVRSTVGKGYIKITWRFAKGDAEDVQYYEVYRSTKRNSGFKKVYTTKDATKMSYKNTKNLKKGKTYYYKVRAVKVVEGAAYASDWSNKAYRVAK